MKMSKFNSVIQLGKNKSILYNSLSDQFVVFSRGTDLILDGMKEGRRKLYRDLVKISALVPDKTDEDSELRKRHERALMDDTSYTLMINPTVNCNFRCWYCYESHRDKSLMDERVLMKTKKFIDRVVTENKKLKNLNFSFFGGEPLLGFKNVVKPIMRHAAEICRKNGIDTSYFFTTNGYLINGEMINFFKEFENIGFQITLDGNRELHDKTRFNPDGTGSYDKIILNIKSLVDINYRITIRINYTDRNIKSINDIIADLEIIPEEKRKLIAVDFQRVWQEKNGKNVEDIVSDIIERFISRGFNAYEYKTISNASLFPCYADKKNEVLINYNGDVFKCTARDFETAQREGYLNDNAEIVWEKFSFDERYKRKYTNKSCLACRIMPICMGGCSQKHIEILEQDYCLRNYSEQKKDEVILDRFYRYFVVNHINKTTVCER